MALITQPHMHLPGQAVGDLHAGDDFYEALLDAHQGLSEAQSHAFNARLILTLANHIGDVSVLKEAVELAKRA
jgi:hypothetical protein